MSSQEQTTANQTVDPDVDERLATHDLLTTAESDPPLSRFVGLLKKADLVPLLKAPEFSTLLAVPDDVLPGGEIPPQVVMYHVLRGGLNESDLKLVSSVKTIEGANLPVKTDEGFVLVGGARIVRSDVECTNGVIHVVDRLVQP